MSEAYITLVESLNECWFDMSPYGCPTTFKLIMAIGITGVLFCMLGLVYYFSGKKAQNRSNVNFNNNERRLSYKNA